MEKECHYPNNLVSHIFGGIYSGEITGQMSGKFTERFEEILISAVGTERFVCLRHRYRDNLTYREIGELCNGISGSCVCNLIDTANRQLRHPRILRSIRGILWQELAENQELKVPEKLRTACEWQKLS